MNAAQADELLAPLRETWTPQDPVDPLARFLRAAKDDVRTAAANSREYSEAAGTRTRRGFGSAALYWYPID